ncbi:MAG: hypothetical protein AB1942_24955 [Pseudomonadota bacterium]
MRLIKTLLFHILMTFRGLIVGACRILSGLLLFAFLFLLLGGKGVPWDVKAWTLGFAVALGALAFWYDRLLLWLAPEGATLWLG